MKTFNCDDVQRLWDERLDGDLPADAAASFDAHLERCPKCAAAWRSETAWLETLAEDEAVSDGKQFTAGVLDEWQRAARPTILARLRPIVAVAACVMFVAVIAHRARHAAPPVTPTVAVSPAAKPDPVSVLMQEMAERMEQPPAAVRSAIAQTTSMLDFDRLADLLEAKSKG
jgi:anti-sigma factor RsiW